MPHKNREDAEKKAKESGIDTTQVVDSGKGFYIAPQGLKSETAKEVYAQCRANGRDKEYCAKIAWTVEKKANKK